jgi:uncharacterized protein (DUF2141 family)
VALHSDTGQVGCSLYDDAMAFPTHPERARALMFVHPQGHEAVCDFVAPAPGRYAIAAFHDENSNGRMDRNFLGIPTEGTAASNDATGRLGPPHFNDAAFVFSGGTLSLNMRMGY